MMNNKIVADFFHATIFSCPSYHAKTYIFNFPAYHLDTTKPLLITLYTDFTQFLPHPITPTHKDTPQSVGLLWTSDQPVAETPT